MERPLMHLHLPSQELPGELAREIFTRIPGKSVVRFKSLSKNDCDFFNSSTFMADHHQRSVQNPHLLLKSSNGLYLLRNELSKLTVQDGFNRNPFVIGCSNGLICVVESALDLKYRISAWNPATRQVIRLFHYDYLAFVSCPRGFGFDSDANDYKVVLIDIHEEEAEVEGGGLIGIPVAYVKIYSLATRSWKKTEYECLEDVHLEDRPGLMVNGALFWKGFEDSPQGKQEFVLSFDLAHEAFEKIPMPTSDRYSAVLDKALIVHDNSVAILIRYLIVDYPNMLIDIWTFQMGASSDLGECWTELCNVGPWPRIFRPLAIWKNEIILSSTDGVLARAAESHIKIFDQVHNFNGQIRRVVIIDGSPFTCPAFIFRESLLPVEIQI